MALALSAWLAASPARGQGDMEQPFDAREVRLSESERTALAASAYRRQGSSFVDASGAALSKSQALAMLKEQSAKSVEDLLRRAEEGKITQKELKEMNHLYYTRRMFLTKRQFESLERWLQKYFPEEKPEEGKSSRQGAEDKPKESEEAGRGPATGGGSSLSGGGGSGSGGAEVALGQSAPSDAPKDPPGAGEPGPEEASAARDSSPERLLRRLLSERPGLVLGGVRGALEAPDFLIASMGSLREAGVRMIFLELGRGQDQRAVEQLRRARDIEGMAAYIGGRWGVPAAAAKRYAELAGSAWSSGMRVVAVDELEESPYRRPVSEAAQRALIKENARSLGREGRYLLLVGGPPAPQGALLGLPAVSFDVSAKPEIRQVRGGWEVSLLRRR